MFIASQTGYTSLKWNMTVTISECFLSPSSLNTHWLDGGRSRNVLVVWVRNSALAVQQGLDRQHCLVVHAWRGRNGRRAKKHVNKSHAANLHCILGTRGCVFHWNVVFESFSRFLGYKLTGKNTFWPWRWKGSCVMLKHIPTGVKREVE